MPRLANGGTRDAYQNGQDDVQNSRLPEYEPISCAIDPSARKDLLELASARSNSHGLIQKQMEEAARLLADSAYGLNERLRFAVQRLENMKSKREEKGTAKTHEEQKCQDHVAELQEKVSELTEKMELAMRALIDTQASFEDHNHSIKELGDAAPRARRAEQTSDEEVPNGPVRDLADLLHRKTEEYQSLDAHRKYALNNTYVTFKDQWHTGMHGDDVPLPHATKWFDRQGNPVGFGDASAPADDEDDDIQIAREVTSLKCPLTGAIMQEPYTNKHCKHTCEKAAIQDHIRLSGDGAKCPQSGCDQKLSRRSFKEDYYFDEAILRRIKRSEQAARDREADMDETRMTEDQDNYISSADEEEIVAPSGRALSRRPKPEPGLASPAE